LIIAQQSQTSLGVESNSRIELGLLDPQSRHHAVPGESMAVGADLSAQAGDRLRLRLEELSRIGASHTYVARPSAVEAEVALVAGNWRSAQDRLRVTLGSDPGAFADVIARLAAARLASWQGRLSEAEAHLERAEELIVDPAQYVNVPFRVVRTEVLLGLGRPEDAYSSALAALSADGPRPDGCEWLVPLAARALADRADRARDTGRPDAGVVAELDRLRAAFPEIVSNSWAPSTATDRARAALTAWYGAEVGRTRQAAGLGEQWLIAVSAAAARLPWLEVYACWRAAEALLSGPRGRRGSGAEALRRGYALAEQLQTATLRHELEALSSTARVAFSRPESTVVVVNGLPGLTRREQEILHHLVRGLTYAEIARALVISEKTVSSYVSNLLRKTGTTSRVELSQLAARVARHGLLNACR
jgi:DNA-binding CsgD family transcriptional regulator